jgi:hypothetical protein
MILHPPNNISIRFQHPISTADILYFCLTPVIVYLFYLRWSYKPHTNSLTDVMAFNDASMLAHYAPWEDSTELQSVVVDAIMPPAIRVTPPPERTSSSDLRGDTSVQPPRVHYPNATLSARRPNPKLTLTKQSRLNAMLPANQRPSDINYKVLAYDEQVGDLYGICKAVPYLLGPRSLLDNLIALRPNIELGAEVFTTEDGVPVLDPKRLSSMDKAILFVLLLLQRPATMDEQQQLILTRIESFVADNGLIV